VMWARVSYGRNPGGENEKKCLDYIIGKYGTCTHR